MEKKVSLKDIAKKVGVSIAAVSYVMNGQEKEKRVGAEVVKKIREAAEELNYQPNQIARSLRTGSTKSIGLIVADIANPFFSHLARFIEDEAANYGYTVLFGSSDEDAFKSELLIKTLFNRQVDGFIIVPTEGTINQIRGLMRRKVPMVLIDRYFPDVHTNYVILDNYQATYDATSLLIGKGYKNICMIAYKSSLIHMNERIRGYSEALDNSGMSDNKCIKLIRFEHTQKDVDQVIHSMVVQEANSDALLFATNALSVAGLISAKKYNIIIPKQVAIIGFDGGDCFDLFHSPLTYVEQPLEEMGKEAFRVLHDIINGSNKTSHIMLNSSLIVRNSC
ncbi:MAG TPA: substrate-binding domain-containing protein [Bacteroidales bacterium]|nr:substrate-binding domain-containing protein [Bacteroidales bacterium]